MKQLTATSDRINKEAANIRHKVLNKLQEGQDLVQTLAVLKGHTCKLKKRHAIAHNYLMR
jgi:hypothetical protein